MKDFFIQYKNPLLLILAVLLLLMLYIGSLNVENFLGGQNIDIKKVEVENVVLRGYQKGVLSWILKSKYVWSSYTLDHPVVENIYDGQLFDHGRLILKSFSARKVNVNVPQERIYADEGMRAVLVRKTAGDERPVDVWAEQLQYFAQDKKSYVRKEVRIKDQDIDIRSSSAEIDHDANTVDFKDGFELYKEGSKITGRSLLVQIDQERFTASGNVELLRKADKGSEDEFKRKDTKVNSDQLDLVSTANIIEAKLNGNVRIWQEDKQGYADEAYFIEARDEIILRGKAGVVFDKTDWLLDQKTVDTLKNKEAKETIYEKLVMRGDELIISTKTKNMQAKGQVNVSVKHKAATSEAATYDNSTEQIELSGKVQMKKDDGSWVQAAKVLVDIKTERFVAEGQAESTLILKR